MVLGSAIVPLREPTAMDLRARLRAGVGPTEVQALLADLETPVRWDPHIELEDVERHETVVRIEATPSSEADGAKLADEIIARLAVVNERRGRQRSRDGARARLPRGRPPVVAGSALLR